MKYRTDQTFQRGKGEIINQVSRTVPDQALPLATLLKRYVRGQDVAILQPEFQNQESLDEVFPEFDKMDKMQKLEYAEMVRKNVNNIRDRLSASAKSKIFDEISEPVAPVEQDPAVGSDII